MTSRQYEFGVIEWLWDIEQIWIHLPGSGRYEERGGHDKITEVLTRLGAGGWDVATCAASGNWLLWTVRRPLG
ncbi:hypothetical protein DP939_19435 [Spongiactinospora rosea]|uniref:DUF4177 domain-containing protein n=1 Tax=Spongiactinospora rosea TaxID=2248750 RepID=A0A366LXG5_9ACTN|nr:hypothetical protein [Spongiactinospora rosea]RBQ18658.1 hypothetical protein DP939_19435 [Spongiactinospora rosea]